MTLVPEIEDALVEAADTRRSRARAWMGSHPRTAAVLVVTSLSIAGTATAAGVLVEQTTVAEGQTKLADRTGAAVTGSYSVKANVAGEKVCLSIDLSQADRADGRLTTCSPQTIAGPLSQVSLGIVGTDNVRLVTGVVSRDVAKVEATGTDAPIQLRPIDGAPGLYFDVLVSQPGPVTLTARDTSDVVLGSYDSSSLGPIGRGDFTDATDK